MRRALMAALLAGCTASIPPPVDPAALPACAAGNFGVLGPDRCDADADCHACAMGDGCRASASDRCEPGRCHVACCHGRCTVVTSDSGL